MLGGGAAWLGSCRGEVVWGAVYLLQVSKMAGETVRTDRQSVPSGRKLGGVGSLPACSLLGVPFLCPLVTVPENPAILMTAADPQLLDASSDPTCPRGMRVSVAVVAAQMSGLGMRWPFLPENSRVFLFFGFFFPLQILTAL